MPLPIFYLETSVWGSLAPRQLRDRKQVVLRLHLLDGIRGTCAISDIVVGEIADAPPKKRTAILGRLDFMKPTVYPITEPVEALAQAYLTAAVLPKDRVADAMHVAVATYFQLNYLVSWNHRHMTRPMKRLQYESVNRLLGYLSTPLICNPFEACDELRH
jgi:hypothetical protein